ncbi:hypothetical protein BDY19DRAFT_970064 [Irpex rosettiformis]|uniref:Uncharacterized protein n=1 Tax=Irpex rosettiformis TaxID=378272 RepID=A0ACB8TRN9_9APHY|nr:hypothetical protein BDY19DRAFT_970064 [Irpex rosettiformis]
MDSNKPVFVKKGRVQQIPEIAKMLEKIYQPSRVQPPNTHAMLQAVPRLAYYGIGMTEDELEEYVIKKRIYRSDPRFGVDMCVQFAFNRLVKLLSKAVGFRLKLEVLISPKYDMAISFYSNYEFEDKQLPYEDEQKKIHTIMRILGLPKERCGEWHYAYDSYGSFDLRTKPWVRPSQKEWDTIKRLYAEDGVDMEKALGCTYAERMIRDSVYS